MLEDEGDRRGVENIKRLQRSRADALDEGQRKMAETLLNEERARLAGNWPEIAKRRRKST